MASKSLEERLKEIEEKEAQLKARKKALKARASQEERKARTKRRINAGGAVEATMKELTGESDYPAEGERLKNILSLIRRGYEETDRTADYPAPDPDRDRRAEIGKICEEILGRSFSDEDMKKFQNYMTFQNDRGYYPRQMNRQ